MPEDRRWRHSTSPSTPCCVVQRGEKVRSMLGAMSQKNGVVTPKPAWPEWKEGSRKPVRRSCAAADRTGHAMLHAMYQRNIKVNTQFFVEWQALDLVRAAKKVCYK